MQKWEYLRVYRNSSGPMNILEYDINGSKVEYESTWKMLNEMGEKGWELVTAIMHEGKTQGYIFKRPKLS